MLQGLIKDMHSHPFYRPLWRRVAIVITTVMWTGFEIYSGSGLWTLLAVATLALCAWALLISYPKS